MQVSILGPPQVRRDDGSAVAISGGRLRALLGRLAIDAGRAVPAGVLIDAVWGEDPPGETTNALQTLVSRLRRVLGSTSAIMQDGSGYRIAVPPEDVDVHRFTRLAGEGAALLGAGRAEEAAAVLREALALWRAVEPAVDEATAVRLTELRAGAIRDRVDADLLLGRAATVVAELEAVAADNPLDERVSALLMRALAATGRQADALAEYGRVRERLADQLGVDPSPALRDAHLAVLRGAARAEGARTNLPTALSSFVGRDEDLARVRDLVVGSRLVTLVGPGGAGKTRLAQEVAAVLVERFAGGVWLAELAPVTDPADVPQAVLGSLARREAHLLDRRTQQDPRNTLGQLLDRLGGCDALLVLDNCEHLIDACAHLADTLLARCPGLRVLATSREPLAITGEVLAPVVPLGDVAAVQLFADRAAAVCPGFVVDGSTAADVGEIVRRLDGLPLAIELAAARLRSLPLAEITARLGDRFRLLTGGSRTALPRHRTLRAVVEWSWDLLTPAEQLLAERLAVFPAGATVQSATAVCADDLVPAPDVADLLASLVDKSLLHRVAGGERVRMLETIREFGVDRLADRGGGPGAEGGAAGGGALEVARNRHADHFAQIVADAQGPLRTSGQLPWMRLLEVERENVLAALRHLATVEPRTRAVELAVGMSCFWMFIGADADAATWLAYALDGASGLDEDLELLAVAMLSVTSAMGTFHSPADGDGGADAGNDLANIEVLHSRLASVDCSRYPMLALMRAVIAMFADSGDGVRRAVSSAAELGDPWTAAAARMFQANVAENDGDVDLLRTVIASAYESFEALGERWGLASCLQMIGQIQTLDGDLDAAEQTFRTALRLVAELGAHEDSTWLHLRLAEVEARRGNLAEARRMVDSSGVDARTGDPREAIFGRMFLAELERRMGNWQRARQLHAEATARLGTMSAANPVHSHGMAIARATAARYEIFDGRPERAAAELRDAVELAVASRDMPILASVGVTAAMLAASVGNPHEAALRLGAAARLRGSSDHTQPDIAELTTRLRGELGEAGFEDAFAAGRTLARDETIERLRADCGTARVTSTAADVADPEHSRYPGSAGDNGQ